MGNNGAPFTPACTACGSWRCGCSRSGDPASGPIWRWNASAAGSPLAGRRPVTIFGDSSQRRDLTHVADVARAVALAVRWQEPGAHIFNIGTGRNHSVLEMLEALANFTNFTPQVDYQPTHPADVPETLASLEKARILLGWEPSACFPQGNEDGAKKV